MSKWYLPQHTGYFVTCLAGSRPRSSLLCCHNSGDLTRSSHSKLAVVTKAMLQMPSSNSLMVQALHEIICFLATSKHTCLQDKMPLLSNVTW